MYQRLQRSSAARRTFFDAMEEVRSPFEKLREVEDIKAILRVVGFDLCFSGACFAFLCRSETRSAYSDKAKSRGLNKILDIVWGTVERIGVYWAEVVVKRTRRLIDIER